MGGKKEKCPAQLGLHGLAVQEAARPSQWPEKQMLQLLCGGVLQTHVAPSSGPQCAHWGSAQEARKEATAQEARSAVSHGVRGPPGVQVDTVGL